jgi:hypothetical protein
MQRSGGQYIKAGLEAQLTSGRLDASKPISVKLAFFIKAALSIVTEVMNVAESTGVADRDVAVNKHKEPVAKLIDDLKSLNAAVNLLLQQTGVPPLGIAFPQAPATNSSAAKLAVEGVKYKADILRANLDTSRKCKHFIIHSDHGAQWLMGTLVYEDECESLLASQKQIAVILAGINKITMASATLESMLPLLQKVVTTFTLIHAQFSKITGLFANLVSIVKDVLQPSLGVWVKALADTAPQLVGISFSGECHHSG